MGIYVFPTELLLDVLQTEGDDFGKDIIPGVISNYHVMGFVYDGYWADIGTIRRFYEVNLEMASPERPFDFYSPNRPVFTRARFLPPSRVHETKLNHVLMADGCKVTGAEITHAVVGLRSIINRQTVIRSSVIMGADYYETEAECEENRHIGRPCVGIGRGSRIEAAIIDKNARIGRNVHIRYLNRPDSETDNWVARDGIVIVPKNALIPDDTVI